MTPDRTALRDRWLTLCRACGLPGGEEAWIRLDAGYSETTRHYHNWAHIADCLRRFNEWHEEVADPTVVELAFWFHDVVYDSRRSDNEEQSAVLAESFLKGRASTAKVAAMIRATTHRELPGDLDTALLCDIDLSILAADAGRYEAYAKAIRKEYDWVSGPDYRAGRSKVLQQFLARPLLYATERCRQQWEKTARRNLQRELAGLQTS
jgi:predicted metal-dependent HD superfamily phosphohydrolase